MILENGISLNVVLFVNQVRKSRLFSVKYAKIEKNSKKTKKKLDIG